MDVHAAPLNPKYHSTLQSGIDECGIFSTKPGEKGGFAEVSFELTLGAKPSPTKTRATKAEVQAQKEVLIAEKAVGLRGALVAELAKIEPNLKAVKKTLESLAQLKIPPDQMSWTLGASAINLISMATQRGAANPMQLELAKAASNNLSKVLAQMAIDGKSPTSPKMQILLSLQAGLKQAIARSEYTPPQRSASTASANTPTATALPATPRQQAEPTPRRMANGTAGLHRSTTNPQPKPESAPQDQATVRKEKMDSLRQFLHESSGILDAQLQLKVQDAAYELYLLAKEAADENASRPVPQPPGLSRQPTQRQQEKV